MADEDLLGHDPAPNDRKSLNQAPHFSQHRAGGNAVPTSPNDLEKPVIFQLLGECSKKAPTGHTTGGAK
jgi:hypothetical protein